MYSSLKITIVMQSEKWAMHTMHMRAGNIWCAFLRVRPRMYAYPAVLLELLSAAGASFATPLWSVLRIEVKEPLSKGKLMEGERKMDQEQEAEMRTNRRSNQKVCEWQIQKKKSTINHRWRSRWEQGRWFPGFHWGSILRQWRTEQESTIINHKGRQMRCIIQSFPSGAD